MTDFIKKWASDILKESKDSELVTEISRDKEWDEPGEDFGKTYGEIWDRGRVNRTLDSWYGKGASSSRDPSHVDWSRDGLTPEQRARKMWIQKFADRYAVVNKENKYLKIIKKDENPIGFVWTPMIQSTVPFKADSKARGFIRLFADLPHLEFPKTSGGEYTPDGTTLKDEMKSIKQIGQLSEGCSKEEITENNDIPGKRYDWTPNFQFTNEVINDLKSRDLLQLGKCIQVLLPVNRDDAPNYYRAGGGVIRDDGKTLYNGKEATRHDFEPYDILHIQLNFDLKEKKIGIDRYYGHRKDWVGENHTSTERDWSVVPPISRETVDSIINAYKDRGVFEGLLRTIDEYIDKSVGQDVEWYGGPTSNTRYRFGDEADSKDPEAEFMRADKRKMYKEKSQDPRFLKWLQRYIDKYKNDWYAQGLRHLCEEIQNGNIFNYEYHFFEPENPSEEYQKQKFERHEKSADSINRALSDYYSKSGYQGD